MSKYLDKDFFKFVAGFITIIAVSLIIIVVTRAYQEQLALNETNIALIIKSIIP